MNDGLVALTLVTALGRALSAGALFASVLSGGSSQLAAWRMSRMPQPRAVSPMPLTMKPMPTRIARVV